MKRFLIGLVMVCFAAATMVASAEEKAAAPVAVKAMSAKAATITVSGKVAAAKEGKGFVLITADKAEIALPEFKDMEKYVGKDVKIVAEGKVEKKEGKDVTHLKKIEKVEEAVAKAVEAKPVEAKPVEAKPVEVK